MSRFGFGFLAVLASVSAVACTAASEEPVSDVSTNDIIGGIDATNAEFNAVGYVLMQNASDPRQQRGCTGTLIAPQLVLTAKHCAMGNAWEEGTPTRLDEGKVYFVLGQNIRQAMGAVEADSVELAPMYRGGYTRLGSDVAIYHLKTPIAPEVVKPIALAPRALADGDVGTPFIAIGYGTQDAVGTSGTRKIGAVRLKGIKGAPAQAAFSTVEDWIANRRQMALAANPGATLPPTYDDYLRQQWSMPLSNDYEVYVGRPDALGEVQVCHGDSGGPLLRRENGQLFVYGVASTTFGQTGLLCQDGGTYATFGASTLKMIKKTMGSESGGSCALFESEPVTPVTTCLAASCCDEATACYGNAECSALAACFSGCAAGDTTCTNACYMQRAGEYVRYEAYGKCARTTCAGL